MQEIKYLFDALISSVIFSNNLIKCSGEMFLQNQTTITKRSMCYHVISKKDLVSPGIAMLEYL